MPHTPSESIWSKLFQPFGWSEGTKSFPLRIWSSPCKQIYFVSNVGYDGNRSNGCCSKSYCTVLLLADRSTSNYSLKSKLSANLWLLSWKEKLINCFLVDEGKVGVRLRHNSKLTDSCHNYNIKFQLSITEQITYLHNDKAQKVGSTQQSHTSQKKSGHYFHRHTQAQK